MVGAAGHRLERAVWPRCLHTLHVTFRFGRFAPMPSPRERHRFFFGRLRALKKRGGSKPSGTKSADDTSLLTRLTASYAATPAAVVSCCATSVCKSTWYFVAAAAPWSHTTPSTWGLPHEHCFVLSE